MKSLLTLLSRYPFDPSDRENLSKLISEVTDWQKTIELINAHGIIALATYNIKESGLGMLIPENSMAKLENGYLQSIVRNTWLTAQWKEVNKILCDAGIKLVLLKGMALEHTLYGSRGLRQMNDNDILVYKEDALKAWHLLQVNGFSHSLIKSPGHKRIMMDIGKHLPCLYKSGYAIEIHHRLFDNQANLGSPDDPLNTSIEIDVNGTKAWILSHKFQKLHLTDHFERHALEGSVQFRQYADIMLLDNKIKLEFPERFILDPNQVNSLYYRKTAYKINIRSIAAKQRLRYIAGDIFPSVEWMKERYGCGGMRAFLYYPQRLGKLWWLFW